MTTSWHIPEGVNIAFSTRHAGLSKAPYESLNVGLHVGDALEDVLANRALISERLLLPSRPAWLDQAHSTKVVEADNQRLVCADASYTRQRQQVCVVMTADCLPVLICDRQGKQVAAIHAGWRGLCDGIIETTLETFASQHADLIAYLGPAIGPEAFEVGEEVREMFMLLHPETSTFFNSTESDSKFLADLQGLAKYRLQLAGVSEVYLSHACTYKNEADYFSYRRDGITGRMASFIWLT
ncbi:peptidoglycan editing factor PgeF [Shewanella psychropiezotolerans]|uniref:Purine nucleoside phosphorylase n=1 Tax=Shewanella psychropiezotolerans TaxID=2593655 RepID=A0ABX5WUW1_9GAMM|nr:MULTISPECIES: peptidoglycan editing factor PgeF [Shewanella]MPY23271.1 peptidoglycan editing factor PgeF [Shewanella sp. YLB-07]QDO82890.1 peptidoglycan editing factor PgeF [Shewanella psychropiezotolerans]